MIKICLFFWLILVLGKILFNLVLTEVATSDRRLAPDWVRFPFQHLFFLTEVATRHKLGMLGLNPDLMSFNTFSS